MKASIIRGNKWWMYLATIISGIAELHRAYIVEHNVHTWKENSKGIVNRTMIIQFDRYYTINVIPFMVSLLKCWLSNRTIQRINLALTNECHVTYLMIISNCCVFFNSRKWLEMCCDKFAIVQFQFYGWTWNVLNKMILCCQGKQIISFLLYVIDIDQMIVHIFMGKCGKITW